MLHHPGAQPFLAALQNPAIRNAMLDKLHQPAVVDGVDESADVCLERRLYPTTTAPIVRQQRLLPDWRKVREELARRDHPVRLALLWSEYKTEHPAGYQYSQFVELYRRFEKKLSVVLRQQHRAGEKVFVDFCDGINLIDAKTGELIPTPLFVGTSSAVTRRGSAAPATVPTNISSATITAVRGDGWRAPRRRSPSPRCRNSCRCGSTVTCGCTSTWVGLLP